MKMKLLHDTWQVYIHVHILCIFILSNYYLIARCLLICITLFLPFSEHLFLVLFPPLHPKKTTKISGLKKKVKIIFDSVGGHPSTDTKQKEKKF